MNGSSPSYSWQEPKKGSTAMEVLRNVNLTGRYFLITGANQGIGFETAKALAIAGAHVTLACRNEAAAQIAHNKILELKSDAEITVMVLDLLDLSTVETCAKEYINSGKPLHCLILNAGIYFPEQRLSKDDMESTFQVNHLSQFYLTQLLKDTLLKSQQSRVVVVSSCAQVLVRRLTVDQLTAEYMSPQCSSEYHSGMYSYALTKLYNTLFATELQKRYGDKDSDLSAFSCHPGIISSNLSRNSRLMYWGVMSIWPFTSTQEMGAGSVMHCAVSPEIAAKGHGGKYFAQCRLAPAIVTSAVAYDEKLSEKLWEVSAQMIREWKIKREAIKH